jgi:predicted DNA-binding WGR domain protein
MNHLWAIDSELSLDGNRHISDDPAMIAQPYHLYIERTDLSKNMARYYAMSIEPTLFDDCCLTRRWGRIGSRGQKMVHHFDREEEAVRVFLDVLRRKRMRGYRPTVPARPAVLPDSGQE